MDSNIISKYLNDLLPKNLNQIIDNQIAKVSVVSRIELLSWKGYSEIQESLLHLFLSNSIVFPLDEPTIVKAIDLRKNSKLRIPDAIIAATSIVHGLTLITFDNDFNNVKGLKVCKTELL